jgi:hypothetical protein
MCQNFDQTLIKILTHFRVRFDVQFGPSKRTLKCAQTLVKLGVKFGHISGRPKRVAKHPLPDTPKRGVRRGTSDAFPTDSQPGRSGHPNRGVRRGWLGCPVRGPADRSVRTPGWGACLESPWAGLVKPDVKTSKKRASKAAKFVFYELWTQAGAEHNCVLVSSRTTHPASALCQSSGLGCSSPDL